MSRRRYSRTRRALLVGALTLAIYPFPRFSLPAQGAPRRSLGATGRIVANEIVHPLPARSIGELLIAHNEALRSRGLSLVSASPDASLGIVLPKGERWEIPGRMNLSAGGTMVLEAPPSEAALVLARQAARALGLRVAAVDMFTDIGGDPDAMRVIELNSNPSIRLLEESGRSDLILKIWRHTFLAMGLL